MRFLGNKASIVKNIDSILDEKGLKDRGYVFFDAFCGSGSVADYFKEKYKIVLNDNLRWAVVYSKGRIVAPTCAFKKLGFNPFDFLNSNDSRRQDFIYNNYSKGNSDRMYFTEYNAGRIDYFRWQIEKWSTDDLISENEYSFLLACLIESVSDVSNTAGVYGAFLKKWDARALKPIIYSRVDYTDALPNSVQSYNNKIENIIGDIECDILYLDPPYTQNQYGTQYHLLETLIRNDSPSLSQVTGSRPTSPMRSDWSKDIKSHILFDYVIAKTKAKHIVFSYNNDGFLSKEFIEATLKRYGKIETYVCKKINYKKYQNWKSQNEKQHFEYLFYIEKKESSDVTYEAPLNYIGSKSRIINSIKERSPISNGVFYDLFGGGFNVGINYMNNSVVYNDNNYFVKDIIQSLKEIDTFEYIRYMKKTIRKYGLERNDGDSFYRAREAYNSLPSDKKDPRFLLTIILYGFQQQIRFNSNHEFNNPVGMRWFNDKILEKLISFSRRIKEGNVELYCESYLHFENIITDKDFVYLDPPYMLTTGSYNDGKRGFNGWSKELENELFEFCNRLDKRDIRFMLSYVAEHKGMMNSELIDWVNANSYRMICLGNITGISGSKRKEVLITNYE